MDRSRLNASYLTAADESQLVCPAEETLLFDFTSASVPNLFYETADFFLVHFHWQHYIVKYSLPRVQPAPFTVQASLCSGTEDGLEYSAVLSVQYPEMCYEIKVPAEHSYDPAGYTGSRDNCEVLRPAQQCFFKHFLVTMLRAAAAGVSEYDLDEVFRAFQPVVAGVVRKPAMTEWLYEQIKVACFYELKPPRYGEFLVSRLMSRMLALAPTQVHTREYLEALLLGEKQGCAVQCPEQYWLALKKQKQPTSESLTLARRGVLKLLPPLLPQMNGLTEKGEDLLECSMLAYSLEMAYSSTMQENCTVF